MPDKRGRKAQAQDDEDRVTLVDDEGNEHDFTLIDVVEVDQQRYALLLPEEDPEEGAYVFRLEQDAEGEEILVNVDDDAEFDRVVKALEEQEHFDETSDEGSEDEEWEDDDWEGDDELSEDDEEEKE